MDISVYRNELLHDGKRYFLAYCVLAIEPVLLVPLLLSLLKPEQLGVLGAVEALNIVLCGISQLGVKFAYLQFVADQGKEGRGRGFWTATLLVVVAGLLAGMLAATVLNYTWLVPQFGGSSRIGTTTLGGLLMVTNLQMMAVTDLRAKRNPMPFVISSVVRVVGMLALLAWLVPSSRSPVEAVLIAQALALLGSILLLARLGRQPRYAGFDGKLAREFVGYGWPIAIGSLVKYGSDALLPWFCLALVSPAAAGAMALAVKAAAIFDSGFGLPFLMAWGGRIYEWLNNNVLHDLLPRLSGEIVIAGMGASLLAWGFGSLILYQNGNDMGIVMQAISLLPLALMSKLLFVLRSPASTGYLPSRDMRWHIRYALLSLALSSTLGAWAFHAGGAAWGWAAFVLIEALVVITMFVRGNALLRLGSVHASRTCLEQ